MLVKLIPDIRVCEARMTLARIEMLKKDSYFLSQEEIEKLTMFKEVGGKNAN